MSNKYGLPSRGIFNEKTGKDIETTIFQRGVVISNLDPTDSKRVRVRIKGIDDHLKDSELPFAFPLLPKMINIVPDINEATFIFVPNMDRPYSDRLYLGPIISQPQMLPFDSFSDGSTSSLDSGFVGKRMAPSTLPESKGAYPKDSHVALQGRDNTDIIFKPKEVLIRAGKFNLKTKSGDIPTFNGATPAYIQIKHNVEVEKTENSSSIGGVVNVVASKINLLTHKDGSPRFVLNDQDNMISTEELSKILNEAHPLVFGDVLVNYLKMLRNAFINHVHPYHGMAPEDLSGTNYIDEYLAFDIDSMLSKNIKIN